LAAPPFILREPGVIDLGKQSDVQRLYTAIDSSRDAARPFRQNRVSMLREFVGSYYNAEGAQYEVLVNLMNMTADAYTIGLAARRPRVRISTEKTELNWFAHLFSKHLNHLIEEIHFLQTLQMIVLDAFFTLGVSKVFMTDWKHIQIDDDVWADPGRPYIKRLSFDDFGLDMSAKDVRSCKFMWDEYRVPWESVENNPHYDKSVVKQLSPSSKWERGEEEANQITSGSIVDDDEYTPMTDLMDVWLPDINKVAICARNFPLKPLQLVDAGPEGGPYHLLSFAEVPDNVIPTSPAQNLMGLHLLYNGLMRKQSRQAKRQKINPTYRPSATEDAGRMKRVNDGDWVKVNDPAGINVINQGGVDQASVAFSIGVLDLFDRQAGNLRAMAGLGPQAPTLGQEQLIYSASSRKEAKMQQRVHDYTALLMQSVGQLMWQDKFYSRVLEEEVGRGTGVYAKLQWKPGLREGDFLEYLFDIEPYSMTYEPPEAKVQKMERAITQFSSLYPILQQSGGTIDVQELVKFYLEAMHLPELENIITFSQPPEQSMQTPEGPGMPASTTRNYVRQNVPTGGTPEARSANLQAANLRVGTNMNQDQAASLSR
jgi:hypothetical protein